MRYLITLIFVAFLAVPAQAAFNGPGAGGMQQGGFTGPGAMPAAQTVQQVMAMPDDTMVTLTGKLTHQIAKNKYMFRDATGEICVDIDRKCFRGQNVTPANTIRISGEVDKDFGKPIEVDVKMLEVLK